MTTPRTNSFAGRALVLGPAVPMITVFMLLPLLLMGYVSILERGEYGGVDWQAYSGEAYLAFLFERALDDSLSLNTDYLQIFARSFGPSASTTLIALLGFGYLHLPIAVLLGLSCNANRTVTIRTGFTFDWYRVARKFLDWMMLPENAAVTSNFSGYMNSIGGSEAHLDEALEADPAVNIRSSTRTGWCR